MKTQKEIISGLTTQEQEILRMVMTLEQSNLYIKDLKQNRSKENEAIESVVKTIERVICDEN